MGNSGRSAASGSMPARAPDRGEGGEALSPRLRAWYEAGRTLSFRDHRLYYRTAGSGPPLLLLHGYPTASWGWHKVWEWLTRRYSVVTLDLLGSGFSDKPRGGPYDVASLADQAEAVLHNLGMDEAHILAHAYGVTTAQELLARHVVGGRERPFVLRSATFVNGGLFPEGMHPTAIQRLLIGPLGPWVAALAPQPYRLFRKKLARNFGPANQPSEAELAELWELLRFKGGHRVAPRVLQYLRERPARRERWVGALRRAAIPLHLINGAADPVAGGDTPALWRQQVPHGRLTQLAPGIGHYPPLEQPQALLEAFLAAEQEVG